MFSSPLVTYGGFFLCFSFLILGIHAVQQGIYQLALSTLDHLGFRDCTELIRQAFNKVMAGQ